MAGRALAIGDVNGDDYPDVYVVQGATGPRQVANPPDVMYLNDAGTALTQVPIPETSPATGRPCRRSTTTTTVRLTSSSPTARAGWRDPCS